MATASYQRAEVSTEGVTERDNLNRGREKCVIIPSNILLVSGGRVYGENDGVKMYRKNTLWEKVIFTNARNLLTKLLVDVGYLHKCNSGLIFIYYIC